MSREIVNLFVRGSKKDWRGPLSLNAAIAQNVPVIDELLALRVSYERNQSDGPLKNKTLDIDDWAKVDRHTLRGQALLRPFKNDDVEVRLTVTSGWTGGNSATDNQGGTPFFGRINSDMCEPGVISTGPLQVYLELRTSKAAPTPVGSPDACGEQAPQGLPARLRVISSFSSLATGCRSPGSQRPRTIPCLSIRKNACDASMRSCANSHPCLLRLRALYTALAKSWA
jgi:hypothetical protein